MNLPFISSSLYFVTDCYTYKIQMLLWRHGLTDHFQG